MTRSFLCTAVAIALLAPGAATAAGLLSHRAMYEMRLATPSGDGGVEGVSGRLTVEWTDVCDGWTVDQRLALVISFGDESQSIRTYSTFASWESKDGLLFRFEDRTWDDRGLQEEIGGGAYLDGPRLAGEANLTAPEARVVALPAGAVFPTQHTLELIANAQAGKTYVVHQVFDGSDGGAVSEVATVIGASEPTADGSIAVPDSERGWPMRLAFFTTVAEGDGPDYEIAVTMHANGVARDMVISYGDYAIAADLATFEALPDPGC